MTKKVLALLLLLLPLPALAGVCRGEDPCRACKDCSSCAYCSAKNPAGGSCGTLRDQTWAQRQAAQEKRAKRGR